MGIGQMKAYCVILAGGVGSRMGAEIPKQFLLIRGEPIIVHTMRQIMKCCGFEKIVVAIHPDWESRFRQMMIDGRIDVNRVLVTFGGKERHDSISNALKAIHAYAEVGEIDVAVICDAVRPFVSVEVLEDSIRTAAKDGACVATLPAVDTMLEVENGIVRSVPPRARLFHGQAPDSARILLLEHAIDSLTEEERKTITGTAQILVTKGIPVKSIHGDPHNFKITTPSDIEIAERYLV